MNCNQARRYFRIEDIVRRIGAVEKKATAGGREIWFLSPWRDEKTASFKVDTERQTWFDHGGGDNEGGDLIKLVQTELQKKGRPATISAALEWLRPLQGRGVAEIPKRRTTAQPVANGEASKTDLPKFILVAEKPVRHPALVNYVVHERRLPLDLVQRYCREIHFKALDAPKDKKPLFGFGMKNDAGAWEVRAAVGNLKAVVQGEKSITTIYGNDFENPQSLDLIEGVPDFLTKEKLWPMAEGQAVIILNGAKLIGRAIEKIKTEPRLQDIKLVRFWTQNDKTGKQIFQIFCDEMRDRLEIGCMAHHYPAEDGQEFKDLNEWWTKSKAAQPIRINNGKAPKLVSNDTAWNMVENVRQQQNRL